MAEMKMQPASQILSSANKAFSPQGREKISPGDKESDFMNGPALFIDDKKVSQKQAEGSKSAFYISAGHDANHMHYKEISGGDTLDEDYGKLRGIYAIAGYRGANYIKQIEARLFVEGYFKRYDALITYDGAAGGQPFTCEQKAVVQRFGVKLGAYRTFSERTELLYYLDIGQRIWYRGENEIIQGVLCYAERYRWVYFGLGGGINYNLLAKLSVGLDIEGMAAVDSKMRADLYEGGTFVLKGVGGWEFKLPIKYHFLKHISFDLTPYSTWWNITRSDPVLISGTYYYEPDSHTHIEGLLVGLTCSF